MKKNVYKMIPFKETIDLPTKFDLMPSFRCHFRLNPMIAIRFRPDSISIQGPAGDVNAKNGVKCIATTTIPLSSMRKYNYDCNREEVTVWLPYHIVNLKGFFKAFVIDISPAPRNDSESDYSRVEISISTLEERREPIVCILKELFPIMENEKERIICNFEGTATWVSNCNYLMYNPESLMSDTPIILNMSGAYYNRRMDTTTIYKVEVIFQQGYMTNVMILTSTLSIFHTFPATYHLALLMVCTFHSSLDMHDAAHTMMISDIATSAWLIDFCHKAM